MMKYIKIRNVKSPVRGNPTDSGLDFYIPNELEEIKVMIGYDGITNKRVVIDNKILIKPNESVIIPLGIKVIIKEGFDLTLENKSGIASKKGLITGAKIIDNSYRGELLLNLINTSNQNQNIELGTKIVQGIIRRVEVGLVEEISENEFSKESITDRGEGGFGSTGIK